MPRVHRIASRRRFVKTIVAAGAATRASGVSARQAGTVRGFDRVTETQCKNSFLSL